MLCLLEQSNISSTLRRLTLAAISRLVRPATHAGYFLITNRTFVVLSANDFNGDPIEIDSTAATDVKPGAAFNPTTGAFINHAFGDRFPNVGDFDLVQVGTVEINGASFAAGSQGVSGISAQGFDFEVDGILNISPEDEPQPASRNWGHGRCCFLASPVWVLCACGGCARPRSRPRCSR